MSQGNDFANYSASNGAGAPASGDVWFVAVASDDIKQMSIEQLDEAFRLGIISAQTAVWTEGMEAWAPLGEVADLGDDDEGGNEASEQQAGSHSNSSQSDSSHHGSGAMSAPSPFASVDVSREAVSSNARASFAAGPSSVAPVTASFAPSAPFVQSTMPVALNVDEDMPPVRVGRRFRPERWLLAAAAVVGVGVTAYNNSDLFASSPASVASAAAPAVDSKPASRGYDVGGDVGDGVEKGAALPAEPKAKEPADDAPIGASSALAAKEATAKESTKEAAEPAEAAVDKQSLKGSFTKAFNKKAPVAKAPKAAKPRKTAAAKPAKPAKSKKSSAPKAASAFDPLNDSLP
jgi:hypothetical protein